MRKLAGATGRPVTFALTQHNNAPGAWERMRELSSEAAAEGAQVRPQVHGRTVSILLGFQTFHPLSFTPAWGATGLGLLPWQEQVARLQADAELRDRIVTEARALEDDPVVMGFMHPGRVYLLGDPPDYEPPASRSVTAIAASRGAEVWETFLDLLLVDGGRELLNSPVLNYSDGNLDAARAMLMHPTSAFGLGDGGAHAGQTCDASTTTFLLSHWVRDRADGRLPLELAVQKLTSATASLYGLGDRGVLAPGMVGDVNLLDLERLQLRRPEMVNDLPGDAKRFIQRAEGYVATVKSGHVTFDQGEDTGARPGILLRGAR
jgi:N-acyl-D-aspartate/D-glutamate deacylase